MKTKPAILWTSLLGLALLTLLPQTLRAQGTTFTYQGRLASGTNAANGSFDLNFALYDAASGGTQQGSSLTNSATAVSNGLFTVTLDFGNQFPGAARWLEIGVRTNGGGAFSTLTPRQALTPTPYAIKAANAMTVDMGTVSNPSFIGTTTSTPLELFVNNARALRIEPNAASPNWAGGYSGNQLGAGIEGGFIGGGGQSGNENRVLANYGVVGGGFGNQVSTAATFSTIGGGNGNFIASTQDGTIAGGFHNAITNGATFAAIGGGNGNVVGGGFDSIIGGGFQNFVNASFATVPGGALNSATGDYSLAAGHRAKANHPGAFVWADSTDADFASTANDQFLIRAAGGVGIGINNPSAKLHVEGNTRLNGLTAQGSGTGTSEPPDRPNGIITRRIRSTSSAVNQVIARYNQGTLERDGSNAGFIVRYNANPGRITIVAMGMTAAGANVNSYQFIDQPVTAGTVQVFSNAQNVVFFHCQFGDTFDQNFEHTEVSISREAADYFWTGFMTSTFNQ